MAHDLKCMRNLKLLTSEESSFLVCSYARQSEPLCSQSLCHAMHSKRTDCSRQGQIADLGQHTKGKTFNSPTIQMSLIIRHDSTLNLHEQALLQKISSHDDNFATLNAQCRQTVVCKCRSRTHNHARVQSPVRNSGMEILLDTCRPLCVNGSEQSEQTGCAKKKSC